MLVLTPASPSPAFFAPRSALGAEPDAPSRRLRTKAAGEAVVRDELGPLATIFKPAVMTGTEDKFFNAIASLAKRTPFFPLIDGGRTRMQPVWVRDVAAGEAGSPGERGTRVRGSSLFRWLHGPGHACGTSLPCRLKRGRKGRV